ncbi:Cytochrome P450 [Rhypophila sp. PSN 637]
MRLWLTITQALRGAWEQKLTALSSAATTLLTRQTLQIASGLIIAYFTCRTIYNLYFHPLSKYPGPKLAAITDLWWVYASTSGRYPWIIQDAVRKYGRIVRIAPNEIVFSTPQAAKDIYLAQERNMELFVQVGYDALDTGDGGISGETNPARHREIAKRLAPAFSTRNFRAKEPVVHKYLDLFVQRMKEQGSKEQGVELNWWTNWLGLDLSAALTHGEDMGHMRDLTDSIALRAVMKVNLLITMSQITRKIRLLTPLMFLCIPPSTLVLFPKLLKMHSQIIARRIGRRKETTKDLDYLEQIVPTLAESDNDPPHSKSEILHVENIANQLLLAGWQPLTDQFYSLILFLLRNPETYIRLKDETRRCFQKYEDITTESVAVNCQYLQACVQETLRLHPETTDGLPRISPGGQLAIIDGEPIPAGVVSQINYFSASRNARYFAEPNSFRPERWLKHEHPLYDGRYKNDDLKAAKPFSQGPRGCPGGAIATTIIRLFIAKVLWNFDLQLVTGQRVPDVDRDYRFLTFWEKPEFWVRFTNRFEEPE